MNNFKYVLSIINKNIKCKNEKFLSLNKNIRSNILNNHPKSRCYWTSYKLLSDDSKRTDETPVSNGVDPISYQSQKIQSEIIARLLYSEDKEKLNLYANPENEFWPDRDVDIDLEFPNIESESWKIINENQDVDVNNLEAVISQDYESFRETIFRPKKTFYPVDKIEFGESIKDTPSENKTFSSLGISEELVKAVTNAWPHIISPTPIQRMTIPLILNGCDVLCADQTGTGKTLAYVLPLMESLMQQESKIQFFRRRGQRSRGLIILPTRELITQVEKVINTIIAHDSRYSHWKIYAMGGGISHPKRDTQELNNGVDILLTTPERLLKHLEAQHYYLDDITHVIFDEADTMMSSYPTHEITSDFIKALKASILTRKTEDKNINYIFVSATVSTKIVKYLEKEFPKITSALGPNVHRSSANLNQEFLFTPSKLKLKLLIETLKKNKGKRTIIFCNKQEMSRIIKTKLVEKGYNAVNFSTLSPSSRRANNFNAFNSGKAQILVSTDLASRGLDIEIPVDLVILYDFPKNSIDYIHRIGRTARAGKPGKITAFVTKKDRRLANEIKNSLLSGKSFANIG